MIRQSLIFFYILAILLISGFAKASTQNTLPISSFELKQNLLHVQGYFTNSCQRSPRLHVAYVGSEGAKTYAYLEVLSDSKPKLPYVYEYVDQICAPVKQGSYDIVVDVRTLALPEGTPIEMKFTNLHSSAPAAVIVQIPYHLAGYDQNMVQQAGVLQEVQHRGSIYNYMIVTASGKVEGVISPIELKEYVGSFVMVSGSPQLELQNNAIQFASYDTAASSEDSLGAPIILTSVSSLVR